MVTHLTPHFTLEEMTHSQTAARKGINNIPSKEELANLQRMAETMERVRVILGDQPILISSGYRSHHTNAAVGGSKNSAHTLGFATDFICPDFGNPLQVCKALADHLHSLQIDQLIYEFGTWIHIGLREANPRHQILTIDSRGTRLGLP